MNICLISAVAIVPLFLKSNLAQMENHAGAETIEFNNKIDEKGQYTFNFATSNGLKRSETGNLDPDGSLEVQGTYEYTDPDGKTHIVSFYADRTGYHPTIITREQDFPIAIQVAAVPPSVVASLLG